MTDPKTFEKFQPILEYFANFQKFSQMKQSGKSRLAQTYFSHEKALIRWSVENFKWSRCSMVSCHMNKHTTEEALKSYKGEIWETPEKH